MTNWSYFYQKAELERQFGRWDVVAELGDQAQLNRLTPVDSTEWSVVIEGYLKSRQYDRAVQLTQGVLEISPLAVLPVSLVWQEVLRNASGTDKGLLAAARNVHKEIIWDNGK